MPNSEQPSRHRKSTRLPKPQQLQLLIRLATESDGSAVNRLRSTAYRHKASWAEFQKQSGYLDVDKDSPTDQTLVATLRNSSVQEDGTTIPEGAIVGTVRLGIAKTVEELHYQLGAVVPAPYAQLPVLTAARAATSLPGVYAALRMCYLQWGGVLAIDGKKLASQMGVNAAGNPVARQVITLRYTVFPVYEGDFLFTGDHVCNYIEWEHFPDACGRLRQLQMEGKCSNFEWQGPCPFDEYVPNYIKPKNPYGTPQP